MIASYRVRVVEESLTEELTETDIYSNALPNERLEEFAVDLTISAVKRDSLLVAFLVHDRVSRSPAGQTMPDLAITARLDPQTGEWLGFSGMPEGAEAERIESWLRRLVLIPPDGGQISPGIIWSHLEPYRPPGVQKPVALDVRWHVQHERTDTLDGVPVASLLLDRRLCHDTRAWVRVPGQMVTASLTGTGFARVDARTGLVRAMELRDNGYFGYPPASGEGRFPWTVLGLEASFTAVRTGLTDPDRLSLDAGARRR